MAETTISQAIRDAEIDARSLSEFIYKPADFMVARRLAPPIHTLDYYTARLESIEQQVQDAINNTAVEGGVIADTFVTKTVNGTGQVARTQRDKNSDSISVKDFGAIGDGVADDAAAIQTAIDNSDGRTIHIPAGTYRLNSTVLLRSNTRIVGDGVGSTVIRTTDTGVDYQYTFYSQGTPESRVSNVSIQGLTLDPIDPKPTSPGMKFYNAIRFNNTDNIIVQDIESKMGHSNIVLSGCKNFSIERVVAYNNTDAVIVFFRGTSNGIVSNCKGFGVSELVDFFNNEDITIRDCYAEASDADNEAVDLSSSRRIMISNCTFKGFGDTIKIKIEEHVKSSDLYIDRCKFLDFSKSGILATLSSVVENREDIYVQNVNITNCRISSTKPSTKGFFYEDSRLLSDVLISGCHIDCAEGVFIKGGSEGIAILDNTVVSTGAGITVQATGSSAPTRTNISNNMVTTSSTTTTVPAIKVDRAIIALVEGNDIDSKSSGIFIYNTVQPVVRRNTMTTTKSGIEVRFSNSDYVDTVNKVLGATITENNVVKFGTSENYRSGILIDITFSEPESEYRGLRVQDNKVATTVENQNSTYGIHFSATDILGVNSALFTGNEAYFCTHSFFKIDRLLSESVNENNITIANA